MTTKTKATVAMTQAGSRNSSGATPGSTESTPKVRPSSQFNQPTRRLHWERSSGMVNRRGAGGSEDQQFGQGGEDHHQAADDGAVEDALHTLLRPLVGLAVVHPMDGEALRQAVVKGIQIPGCGGGQRKGSKPKDDGAETVPETS